jgi:hypothetical protein
MSAYESYISALMILRKLLAFGTISHKDACCGCDGVNRSEELTGLILGRGSRGNAGMKEWLMFCMLGTSNGGSDLEEDLR